MRGGGGETRISEGGMTRAALTTNMGGRRDGGGAFPELYYKCRPVETKHNQARQKMELENFGGRLVDNIKQDFHAMMTDPDMLTSGQREANEKTPRGKTEKRKCEHRASESHAAGAPKDRLIGMLTTDDSFARNCLHQELASETRRRAAPARLKREVSRKAYLRKPHFHHNHKSNC
jgi:hypothetical protein